MADAASSAGTAGEVAALRARAAGLEQALTQARHRAAQLEAIIDHAPLAIYLKDARHQYLAVNAEYERLSATPRDAILGREDFALFPPAIAQVFREQDLTVEQAHAPVEFKETLALPVGTRTFITSKFPVRTGPGEGWGVAGVCTDITALEAARSQLEKTQAELVSRERLAALGELAAVIAHEVRNPLAVVFNALATLRHLPLAPREAPELLAIIQEEAERLERMVGALLDLVRPVAASPTLTDLIPLLGSAIDAARAMEEVPSPVTLEVPAGLLRVPVDGALVRQAVANLVGNALHAPGRKGPVEVKAWREGDTPGARLVITVRDDGQGIPLALAQRIFEPFFTTRARGTGLGLAVVTRVMAAHGGAVTHGPSPGGGATFRLEIPLVEVAPASTPR